MEHLQEMQEAPTKLQTLENLKETNENERN